MIKSIGNNHERIGINPYFLKEYENAAKRFSMKQLVNAMGHILEADLDKIRHFKTFQNRKLIRLAIGLEEPEDLIADLRQAFKEII